MEVFREMKKYLLLFAFAIGTLHLPSDGHAQSQLKKVRMGSLQPTALFWLFMPRFTVDFFRDEGIDLEIIFMPVNLASIAF